MLVMSLPGDSFEMVIDQATGVVLAMVESFEDVEVSAMEWTAFDMIRRSMQMSLIEHFPTVWWFAPTSSCLWSKFVHKESISPASMSPIRTRSIELLHGHRRSPGHQLDQYIATGPPPVDATTATAAIIEAYSLLDEADGDHLPHVEAGTGSASVVQRAAERFPSSHATFEVSEVKFLNSDRAAVVFSIDTTNGGSLLADQIGEAVLHEQRWCVARSTFARLMSLAGVDVPAP